MSIQKKEKYYLSKLLANLIYDHNVAKTYCDATIDDSDPANIISLNTTGINLINISALEMWDNIITAALSQNLLGVLLEAIKKQNSGNAELIRIHDDFINGFKKRVEKIATAIKRNECVLFLGPELLQCLNANKKTEAFSSFFSKELSKRLYNAGVYFDKDLDYSISYIANRYEDMPNVANRELGLEAKKSFDKAKIYKTVFDKIAQLKFPLVISTNPDDILDLEYDKLKMPYSSGFYDRSNQNINTAAFEEDKSIIYKIFGSFQNPYSILFTDNDRVQFSKNVVKNDPPIPPLVKILLDNKFCIFLGFNFQEWHLKILIDCLGLAKKEDRTFALLMDSVNESSIEHFEKNYKFYFINEDIELFLDEVIKKI